MNRTFLPLLVLLACRGPESGLDESTLTGTLVIPPAAYTESETRTVVNDEVGTAFPVGPDASTSLTYRSVVVTGETEDFTPTGRGAIYGDPDHYAFSPVADGDFTLTFALASGASGPPPKGDTGDTGGGDTGGGDTGGGDTGGDDTGGDDTGGGDTGGDDTGGGDTGAPPAYTDPVVYDIVVYDLAAYDGEGAGVVWSGSTDGAQGSLTATFPVAAGGDYVVLVGGIHADDPSAAQPYQLVLSGSTPGDLTILVGAYTEGDPAVGSPPVGGSNGTGWTYDPATWTWTGTYSVQYVRSVVGPTFDSGFDPATDPYPNPEIDEDVGTVYLMAGTLTSLNATPAAGALYTSTSVEVAIDGGEVAVDTPLVLDGTFPKVIGVTVAEATPDTTYAELNADYTLNLDTLVAQDVGMLSGLGYVDVFDGTAVLDPETSGWNGGNDSDAYAFTVPEPMYVRLVASWPDAAADIDFGIWGNYDPYGTIDYFSSFSDSYCLTGANPEVCETIVPLEPDVTYYLVALGYLGTDEQPYHVELEWIAP